MEAVSETMIMANEENIAMVANNIG